jgi:hypothetical protein
MSFCINIITNQEIEFESRKAVAEHFKCKHTTVSEAIRLNRIFCKNYKLKNGNTF